MRSLKHRLMLVFALVALPPTLMGVVEAVEASRLRDEWLEDAARNYAMMASTYHDELIENSTNLLMSTARRSDLFPQVGKPDRSTCAQALTRAIRSFPVYVSLNVLGRDGSAICGSDPERLPGNAGQQEYFRQAVATKTTFLSGYVMGSEPDVPTLVLAQPVLTETAEVKAVLVLAIRLDRLKARGRFLSLPEDGIVYLLDRDGLVVHGVTVPANLGSRGVPPDLANSDLRLGRSSTFELKAQDGITRVYAVSALESGSLFALVGVPKRLGSGWVDRDLMTLILLVLAIWISGVLAAWLGTRLLVTRWTERLFETTSAMSKGDLSARADLSGAPAEIRQLGDTLAEMATRLNARQAELKAAVDQKGMMLREIHHRIKNNLQTVTSLFNLYCRGIRNGPAMQALHEVRIRTQALGLVYRHLYENLDHQSVGVKALLGELCQLIQASSGVAPTRVALNVDVAPIDVEIECAEPLALLVTELVTNAFKHAFPDNRSGTVGVRLTVTETREAELIVSDDGIGPSQAPGAGQLDVFAAQAPTLGLSLIRGLATQLGAETKIQGPPGSSILVRFPLRSKKAACRQLGEDGEQTLLETTS